MRKCVSLDCWYGLAIRFRQGEKERERERERERKAHSTLVYNSLFSKRVVFLFGLYVIFD